MTVAGQNSAAAKSQAAEEVPRGLRAPGDPKRLRTAAALTAPVGRHIDPGTPKGYYIDFTAKTDDPVWPPEWYLRHPRLLRVVIVQWGLGCHERYLDGQGEAWLAAAVSVGEHLLAEQVQDGPQAGGWVHDFPYKHTYKVSPPWLSGMAQGEAASLLVRLYRLTDDERFADTALKALRPLRVPGSGGGTEGRIDGGFLPEEYPTEPASHVLNGAIFGIWGCYDTAVGLGDPGARKLADEGIATLAAALRRYDTGSWSLYDLYPHPVRNVASPMYHRLHTDQLTAMARISTDPRFATTAARFERYSRSRLLVGHAFARKALFRLAVPRNQRLARRVPWGRGVEA